jgi:hypothetical protein
VLKHFNSYQISASTASAPLPLLTSGLPEKSYILPRLDLIRLVIEDNNSLHTTLPVPWLARTRLWGSGVGVHLLG